MKSFINFIENLFACIIITIICFAISEKLWWVGILFFCIIIIDNHINDNIKAIFGLLLIGTIIGGLSYLFFHKLWWIGVLIYFCILIIIHIFDYFNIDIGKNIINFFICDHDWERTTDYERIGFWKDEIRHYHKCSKCRARELCNKDGRTSGDGRHSNEPCCTKCGS